MPAAAPDALAECEASLAARGHVPLAPLFRLAADLAPPGGIVPMAARLCEAFNGGAEARAGLAAAARGGEAAAANLLAWMEVQGLAPAPCRPLAAAEAEGWHRALLADPEGYAVAGTGPYPASAGGRHWGFDPAWVAGRLALGRARLARMAAARRGDIAVLAGNGPSLNATDLSLLAGRDVYVSNYAVRHPQLARLATGVAVTNHFVAAQAPHLFHPALLGRPVWRVFPVWLGHVLTEAPGTVWLNAIGGPLAFGPEPGRRLGWHATVSFFWMQVLYALGYRKVVLVGFDHRYVQPAGAREGTLLAMAGDDPNHFDPGYFRGKHWQAADVEHMGRAYELARRHYEAAGREIVNCTEGGALEVFRRAPLAAEIR